MSSNKVTNTRTANPAAQERSTIMFNGKSYISPLYNRSGKLSFMDKLTVAINGKKNMERAAVREIEKVFQEKFDDKSFSKNALQKIKANHRNAIDANELQSFIFISALSTNNKISQTAQELPIGISERIFKEAIKTLMGNASIEQKDIDAYYKYVQDPKKTINESNSSNLAEFLLIAEKNMSRSNLPEKIAFFDNIKDLRHKLLSFNDPEITEYLNNSDEPLDNLANMIKGSQAYTQLKAEIKVTYMPNGNKHHGHTDEFLQLKQFIIFIDQGLSPVYEKEKLIAFLNNKNFKLDKFFPEKSTTPDFNKKKCEATFDRAKVALIQYLKNINTIEAMDPLATELTKATDNLKINSTSDANSKNNVNKLPKNSKPDVVAQPKIQNEKNTEAIKYFVDIFKSSENYKIMIDSYSFDEEFRETLAFFACLENNNKIPSSVKDQKLIINFLKQEHISIELFIPTNRFDVDHQKVKNGYKIARQVLIRNLIDAKALTEDGPLATELT